MTEKIAAVTPILAFVTIITSLFRPQCRLMLILIFSKGLLPAPITTPLREALKELLAAIVRVAAPGQSEMILPEKVVYCTTCEGLAGLVHSAPFPKKFAWLLASSKSGML